MGDGVLACHFETRHEGEEIKLVADCKSCKDGKADLDDPACFKGVLEAWATGLGADTIVLAGTVETQYSSGAVELVDRMAGLVSTLRDLSRRGPVKGKQCDRCKLSPSALFGDLHAKLASDLRAFYLQFRSVATKVSDAKFHDKACDACLSSTKDDMVFFHGKFEGLLRFVIKEGFSIVL